jgi:hypothetical protein
MYSHPDVGFLRFDRLLGTGAPDRSRMGGVRSFWVAIVRLLMCRGRGKRWYDLCLWGDEKIVGRSRRITLGG